MNSNNEKITSADEVKKVLWTAREIPNMSNKQIIDNACFLLDNYDAEKYTKFDLYILKCKAELDKREKVLPEGLGKLSCCLEVLKSSTNLDKTVVIKDLDQWIKQKHSTISNQGGGEHVEDHSGHCNSKKVQDATQKETTISNNVVTSENAMEAEESIDNDVEDSCNDESDKDSSNDELGDDANTIGNIDDDSVNSTPHYSDSRSTNNIVEDVCTLLKSSSTFVELLPNWIESRGASYALIIAQNMKTLLERSDVTKENCNMLSDAFKDTNNSEFADLNKDSITLMQRLNEKVVKLNGNNSNVVTSANDMKAEESVDSDVDANKNAIVNINLNPLSSSINTITPAAEQNNNSGPLAQGLKARDQNFDDELMLEIIDEDFDGYELDEGFADYESDEGFTDKELDEDVNTIVPTAEYNNIAQKLKQALANRDQNFDDELMLEIIDEDFDGYELDKGFADYESDEEFTDKELDEDVNTIVPTAEYNNIAQKLKQALANRDQNFDDELMLKIIDEDFDGYESDEEEEASSDKVNHPHATEDKNAPPLSNNEQQIHELDYDVNNNEINHLLPSAIKVDDSSSTVYEIIGDAHFLLSAN